jgi:YspA, cpYpsA-related SLOG family
VSDYRVLITGSRDFTRHQLIRDFLDLCREDCGDGMVVVHGDNPRGADAIAALWVVHTFRYATTGPWVAAEPHPAKWGRLGGAAGPVRNQEMVDLGADICGAFFKVGAENKGTSDCADRARAAGINVWELWA